MRALRQTRQAPCHLPLGCTVAFCMPDAGITGLLCHWSMLHARQLFLGVDAAEERRLARACAGKHEQMTEAQMLMPWAGETEE